MAPPECLFLAVAGSAQWAVYALGALTIVYVVFRPSLKRKKKDPLADAAPRLGLAQQRSVERQMQNLLVELSDMSRQITAQIDTRAARLEALIEEAQEKIDQLQRLSPEPQPARPQPDPQPLRLTIPPTPQIDRYGEIYELADAGHNPGQIAATLGRPRGEIELILALRARA